MDNVGMEYTVRKAVVEETEIQTNLNILFLLEGTMTVEYYEERYQLQKDDILLISPGIPFAITECQNALYGNACFSSYTFAQITASRNMIFHCNSVIDVEKSYDGLRKIFLELTKEYAKRTHQTKAYTDSLLLRLVDILVEEFQFKDIGAKLDFKETDKRMKEMMQYILANLDQELSLNDLAERMFVSPSTLSRVFKKSTGQYFADFVLEMRVKNAMNLLVHTQQNVTQIALSCGFTNSASFNRAFKKLVNMTPIEYRSNSSEKTIEDKTLSYNEENVKKELEKKGYTKAKTNNVEEIFVNLNTELQSNYKKLWKSIINIGAISLLANANMQYHALYLNEQLHFKYYRVWNIFDKKLMITDGTRIGYYNYDLIDQIFDFLISHKLTPFLDFGRRPNTAFRSSGNSVYLIEECIDFKSKEIWKHMIADFINHLVLRYGIEEVSTWKFELTRNGFHDKDVADNRLYDDDNYNFFDAFKIFYNIIKQKMPNAEVGGVGGTVINDKKYLLGFINKCVKANIKLDFVSLIIFPYVQSYDNDNGEYRMLSGNSDYELSIIKECKDILKETKMESNTKIIVTEWNNTLSNRNYLNDSCFRAAYISSKMTKLIGKVEAVGVLGGSDWISNYVDSVGILNGAVGLISKGTIRKPAFYAIDFLNQLGNILICKGDNYIVTRKENGDVYILTFNQSWFKNSYLFKDEDLGLKVVDSHIYNNDKSLQLQLHIEGFTPNKLYCIKRRTLNNEHGSALREWKKFEYDTRLIRSDVKYIQAISIPHLTQQKEKLNQDNTAIDLDVTMEVHEIDLIHIFESEE
ncbi:GH39 family glycosyl hydrolase [Lachnobacterium bovis]|uniref:GH39 family glycosyl hydrolase n=1 Tax=Lachnobacterium bovis TaxID=140626 RepID=UPI000490F0B7|nr:helix-turn-helix domain-containing protein [Lachnobacterium bovis]